MSQRIRTVYVFGRTPPTDLLNGRFVGRGECDAIELKIYPDWIDVKKDVMEEAVRIVGQSDVLDREHEELWVVISSLGVLASAITLLIVSRCRTKRVRFLQVYRPSPLAEVSLAEFSFDLPCLFQQSLPHPRE